VYETAGVASSASALPSASVSVIDVAALFRRSVPSASRGPPGEESDEGDAPATRHSDGAVEPVTGEESVTTTVVGDVASAVNAAAPNVACTSAGGLLPPASARPAGSATVSVAAAASGSASVSVTLEAPPASAYTGGAAASRATAPPDPSLTAYARPCISAAVPASGSLNETTIVELSSKRADTVGATPSVDGIAEAGVSSALRAASASEFAPAPAGLAYETAGVSCVAIAPYVSVIVVVGAAIVIAASPDEVAPPADMASGAEPPTLHSVRDVAPVTPSESVTASVVVVAVLAEAIVPARQRATCRLWPSRAPRLRQPRRARRRRCPLWSRSARRPPPPRGARPSSPPRSARRRQSRPQCLRPARCRRRRRCRRPHARRT